MASMMKQRNVCPGLLGEQGAESIHSIVNNLERIYANIRNIVEKPKALLKEHSLQTCPQTNK